LSDPKYTVTIKVKEDNADKLIEHVETMLYSMKSGIWNIRYGFGDIKLEESGLFPRVIDRPAE